MKALMTLVFLIFSLISFAQANKESKSFFKPISITKVIKEEKIEISVDKPDGEVVSWNTYSVGPHRQHIDLVALKIFHLKKGSAYLYVENEGENPLCTIKVKTGVITEEFKLRKGDTILFKRK